MFPSLEHRDECRPIAFSSTPSVAWSAQRPHFEADADDAGDCSIREQKPEDCAVRSQRKGESSEDAVDRKEEARKADIARGGNWGSKWRDGGTVKVGVYAKKRGEERDMRR